jgi:membrane-bound lytic murein transglycosylase D
VANPSAAEQLKHLRAGVLAALALLSLGLPGAATCAAEEQFPQPVELQPDINFWVRVYTAISTSEGFIHDQRNLAVVYETLLFDPGASPQQRQARVDATRERYQAILRYLATGAPARDAADQQVRDLWPAELDPARLRQAADEVRFQLGQSDRFRAGLIRATALEKHIVATLAAEGLPAELAALPHVESSFDPDAYSKVGAAGLWQFMRSTGRRFMRIDSAVDERLDPYRATEAAAQLLAYNYRVLGTWPLALTAYNHGAEGTRRARDRLGTSDIARIVREYNSPLFGFASRNFYVSFLAASNVAREPARYFGALPQQPATDFYEVALRTAANLDSLQRVVKVSRAELQALNPALRPDVWSGKRAVPVGYRLRLPAGSGSWDAESLTAALGRAPARVAVVATTPAVAVAQAAVDAVTLRSAAPTGSAAPADAAGLGSAALEVDAIDLSVAEDNTIRVAAGETLGHFADWAGASAAQLRALNALGPRSALATGHRFRLSLDSAGRVSFERRRRSFHQRLQAEYFAAHRITGSLQYQARAGDSLWSVARAHGGLPEWLVQQYNPDVDFANLKAGMRIVLPQVEPRTDV